MDTSANDHMCHDRYVFKHLVALSKSCQITLPNGQDIEDALVDVVLMNNGLFLHEVLYAPIFKYNSSPISKLCA